MLKTPGTLALFCSWSLASQPFTGLGSWQIVTLAWRGSCLSIALFIILVNFLESGSMLQGGWVVVDVCDCRCRRWPFIAAWGPLGRSPETSRCGAARGSCQSGGTDKLLPTPGQLHVTPGVESR